MLLLIAKSIAYKFKANDLNTSNVTVNRCKERLLISSIKDLNTSNVTVNLFYLSVCILGLRFKYI